MPLYVPRLAADAAPPLRFPPTWVAADAVAGGSPLIAATAAVVVLTRVAGGATNTDGSGGLRQLLVQAAGLALLLTAGYAFISRWVLRRRGWLTSRYGSQAEYAKLLASVPVVVWLGGGTWIVGNTANVANTAAAFLVAYWGMLHFIYCDNSAFLQVFGCKWPDPAKWRTCRPAEAAFAVVVFGIAGGIVASRVATVTAAGAWPVVAMKAGIVAAAVLAPAVMARATHALHLHHYVAIAVLLPVTAFPDAGSAACQGIMLAVYVDGLACWGMDPTLVPRRMHPLATDASTVAWLALAGALGNPAEAGELLSFLAAAAECVDGTERLAALGGGGGELAADFQLATTFAGLPRRLRDLGALLSLRVPPAPSRPDRVACLAALSAVLRDTDVPAARAAAVAILSTVHLGMFGGSIEVTGAAAVMLATAPGAPHAATGAAAAAALPCNMHAAYGSRDAFWEAHRVLRAVRDKWYSRCGAAHATPLRHLLRALRDDAPHGDDDGAGDDE